jgi:hypothetical protein
MQHILQEISEERNRQKTLALGGDTEDFDKTNGQGDWVSYICAYAGRAPVRVFRNKREGQSFRGCMVKVAALAVAAIQAYDAGHAQE